MRNTPEWLAFRQAYAACQAHEAALRDALGDLLQRRLTASDLENPDKGDRRLLDQFAYRYTRLRDDRGARLIPAILRLLGEEIASLPMLDRLARMEQLGWLPNAEEWSDMRRIRNEFTHGYPETPDERFERLHLALAAAQRVLNIFQILQQKALDRFSELRS